MWKRCNGFFLPELLLSLLAWLIIASVLFPLIIGLINRSVQMQQDYGATQVLYETLQKAKKEETVPINNVIEVNRTFYEIYQELSSMDSKLEVCVKYEDVLQKEYKKCEVFE